VWLNAVVSRSAVAALQSAQAECRKKVNSKQCECIVKRWSEMCNL